MNRVVWTLAVILLCGGAAAAQDKRNKRLEGKLAKVGKKLGVPVEALRAVGGERFLSRKALARQALLASIAAKRTPELVPVVLHMALHDKDLDCRISATALISVVGLEADRAAYLKAIVPALSELFADKHEKVCFGAADEANRLARWFKLDKEVAPLLEKTFDGKHYRMAVRAWKGLLALENEDLRQGLVMRAMREVQDRRSRFAVFERRAAFRENGIRRGPWTARELAALVVEDGTVAVACTQALADLGDPVALPSLRRIDRTSAHVLRVPALMTRGVLQDETLLDELPATLESDHVNIKVALVAAIARLETPKVDKVLSRVAKIAQEPALRQAVALARLHRGDAGDEQILREALTGDTPDPKLAGLVLNTEHEAAGPLVVHIAGLTAKPMATQRLSAVARLGTARLDTAETRALLRELLKGGKAPLRLFAATSLLQLGAKDGEKVLTDALTDYDVVNRVDVSTKAGTGKRFNGSPLIAALERLGEARTLEAAPLLSRWLDPPEPKAQAPAPADEGTRERQAAPKPDPARVPPWLSHQFVRRTAVETLGVLAQAFSTRVAAPQEGDDPADLKLGLERTIRALARCRDDARGVVQRAALRGLAPLAGTELPIGADLQEEEEVAAAVEAWLKQREKG